MEFRVIVVLLLPFFPFQLFDFERSDLLMLPWQQPLHMVTEHTKKVKVPKLIFFFKVNEEAKIHSLTVVVI